MVDQIASAVEEFFRQLRQGHVLSVETEGESTGAKQLAVISQTCDVVLSKRPTVVVAPVITLTGTARSQAATGTNPRLIPLPHVSDSYFVDLCFIGARDKRDLVGCPYVPGIDLNDAQVKRDFSLSITRWFGRFPFPDEVVPWLRPLEHVIREKYRKQSPLGEMLRSLVVEVRVEEASQWITAPCKITVHTIVPAEALPTISDDNVTDTTEFARTLREPDDRIKSPAQLADILSGTEDVRERHHVLDALAESFAALCTPSAESVSESEAVARAVVSVDWQLWGDDEFPLARVRKSEPLDLAYLSEPDHAG